MDDFDDVIRENIEYYLEQEKILAGTLSSLPKGRIRKKQINGDIYYYLQFRKGKKIIDKYLGKSFPKELSLLLKKRKNIENELKNIRAHINFLTKRKNNDINLVEPIKNIFEKLTKQNLWEQGVEIIGSWCFLIYQKYFDFPKYPIKTDDIDILIPLPYKGKHFDFSSYLKSLGFHENFNPDGSIFYSYENLRIDFLSPLKREKEYAEYIKQLGISPQQLKFLDILLNNPITLKLSRSIKIKIPAPSSFLLHKLLIANRRREKGKKIKDLKQAIYTGKYVLVNEKEDLLLIYNNFSKSWKNKIKSSLKEAEKFIFTEPETISQILNILK